MKPEQVENARKLLKELLADHPEYDATSLARAIGRGDGYIRDFINGRKGSLGAVEIYNVERLLNLPIAALYRSPDDLQAGQAQNAFRLKNERSSPPSVSAGLLSAYRAFGPVHVDGVVAAGVFRRVDFPDDLGLMVSAPRDPVFPYAKQVAFQVAGDSMNESHPKPINDGDFIICALWDGLEVEEENGLNVVIEQSIDNGMYVERTLKELRIYEDRYECVPRSSNKSIEPIIIKKSVSEDKGKSARIHSLVRFVFDSQPLPNGRPRIRD